MIAPDIVDERIPEGKMQPGLRRVEELPLLGDLVLAQVLLQVFDDDALLSVRRK